MAIVYRPMVAIQILECVLALLLLLLLLLPRLPRLLPQLLPPPPLLLLLPQLLFLPQLLLQKTGDAESNTGTLYVRLANAARRQDGVDQRVTTAYLRAVNLISVLAMLSMSYLLFH